MVRETFRMRGFRMSKIDKVFGELEYEYCWYKDTKVNLFGEDQEITIMIDGELDEEIEEGQYEAYTKLVMKLDDKFYSEILNKILEYYKETRYELGYEDEENEMYPQIDTIEEILEHIELNAIVIKSAFDEGERLVGLTFGCTWNEEDGVGISLINEKIDEVGYGEVAL